ncbi:MAG: DegT/DnrJ/EryC1/StrS family aminotransferase [Proteobacteria bacterium]|nr:DegT/DnrJ/EryC1/StrS family aminotransferase [Pseudomonadota bacterium]
MRIPLLDLTAQYRSLQPELDAAVHAVLASQDLILGPEVAAFEREIAAYLGTPHAVGVSNGTDALILAFTALGIGAGDEVVTPAYSFFATAEAIVRCGARPVFVDIDPLTMQMDLDQAIARVGPQTRAFCVVHLFGRCCPVQPLRAAAPDLPVVEDAAQAIGAEVEGARAGALGALGCFSFFPSKNLGCFGDGGLVTTADAALAGKLRALRVHGQAEGHRHEHTLIGGNFRLDALQAAVLRVKLRHLDQWTARRSANAARYRERFAASAPQVLLPAPTTPGTRDVHNQFVIRVARDRDGLRDHLAARGIGTGVYYPRPLHLQPALAELGHRPGDFPHAEHAAATNLALPIFPELPAGAIDEIVETIAAHPAASSS